MPTKLKDTVEKVRYTHSDGLQYLANQISYIIRKTNSDTERL